MQFVLTAFDFAPHFFHCMRPLLYTIVWACVSINAIYSWFPHLMIPIRCPQVSHLYNHWIIWKKKGKILLEILFLHTNISARMGSRLPHCWVRLQKDLLEEVEEGLGFCLIPVRKGGLRSVKMDRRSFRHYIINIFICAYTLTSTKKEHASWQKHRL